MALINWDDEEQKKRDTLDGITPVRTVASVQSSAWQPAPSGADTSVATNDIVTPKVNGGIFDQSQVTPVQENYLLSDEKAQVDEQKRQRDAQIAEARRQDAARRQAANALAAEQAAQVAEKTPATPKYSGGKKKNEGGFTGLLKDIGAGIQQGIGGVGDVVIQTGAVVGSVGKKDQALVDYLDKVQKVRDWLHADKDINGNTLIGTQDVEQQANNIAAGNGSVRDWASVGGKGFQTGLDATMFINPTAIAKNAVKPVVTQGAKLIPRIMRSPVLRTAGRDAAFFGTSQGVATTAQEYGRTGDMEEALKAGGTDAVIGGLLQGGLDLAGHGVGTAVGNTARALRPAEKMPIVGGVENIVEDVTPAPQQPVADGVARLDRVTPVNDGNISFETPDTARVIPEPTVTPADVTNQVTPVTDGTVMPTQVAPAQTPTIDAPTSDVTPVVDTTVPKVTEPAPVADGIVRPSENVPVMDSNTPVVSTEQVRQLQESRAGTSQADEAVINQKLKEAEAATPADSSPSARSLEERVFATEDSMNSDGGAYSRAVGRDGSKLTPQINRSASETDLIDALSELRKTPVSERSAFQAQRIKNIEQALKDRRVETSSQPVPENVTPVADNVPQMDTPTDGKLTPKQVSERLMPKLASSKDVKKEIATAAGVEKDAASPIDDILRDGNVKPKQAERLSTQFKAFDKQLREYNRLDEINQKGYAEKGVDGVSEDISKQNRRAGRELGIITRRLMQEIKRLEISGDRKAQFVNGLVDAIGTRNASILTSAGLLERNIFQEITANTKLAIKNPVKMAKSTFGNGNILKDTAKAELSHWGDTPRSATEVVKYVVGNIYRTAMIPTTALANTRRGAVRQEFTKWAFKELEGRELSPAEAKKLSGTAGNEMEALVNTFIGVDNGMSNRGQAIEALKAWKEYIRTGDDAAKADYLKSVETHSSLADQMIAGIAKADSTKARALSAMKNLIFPFVRTATNLMKTTIKQDLNPMAKSLLDEIRADQRGGTANAINLIKSKLVDYGIMGGAAALASAGLIVYNDGDQVDKPRGWSVKVGDDRYVPVRATSLELPIALAGTGQAMWSDIASGKVRDASYYSGMVTGSLPYIDQFNTTTGAVDSLMSGEDGGYAAKSYAVNTAKSFVPFSNNSVQPYIAGKKGESLNAKTVYDKDSTWQWFKNTVQKSYDPDFYNGLKDSRDNAGRVRTVDNQGVVSNKTMNDPGTAEFNDRITDLVDYGREAGLGENTKDMFNTYDTGKNNNFKSIQDTITFLDVEEINGKKTPDAAKKLEKNGKLSGLSAQIREGFFGDTGDELLTLDGKELYSDVSVPNKDGTKNSKLPMNMQSIKNAIAQVDLPEADRDAMYAISQKNDALYAQLKAKSLTYDQYLAAKTENNKTYVDILSGSENYKKMLSLFDELDRTGFFKEDGLGSTRSGQTYLWNSLNALLGSKGATPAANYPDDSKGFTPWGRGTGTGRSATNKPGDRGNRGIQWAPVGKRSMASVTSGKYTPVSIKVKLGNEVKKNKTQNYTDRNF